MATESSLHANAIAAAIARVAKARRSALGLSLDALVRASGVSKGMLVEIERGSGNPSIATLCKLAAGLGISVADLIAVEPEAIAHVVAEEDATILWRGPSGGSARLLIGTPGPDMLELWRWVLYPGECYDSEAHSLGTVELIRVEAGYLQVGMDQTVVDISTGSAALLRTDRPHSYAARGEHPTHFTMFVAEWSPQRARTGVSISKRNRRPKRNEGD